MSKHQPLSVKVVDSHTFCGGDLVPLARRLEDLRKLASASPDDPRACITYSKIFAALNSAEIQILLQYKQDDLRIETVTGFVVLTHTILDNRVWLGPICVDQRDGFRGYGTPLMEAAIAHVQVWQPQARSIDLTNRPEHDQVEWYKQFGFSPRDTRVLRLTF